MPIGPLESNARYLDTGQFAAKASGGSAVEPGERLDTVLPGPAATPAPPSATGERSFGQVLTSALQDVNRLQLEADHQAELVATGEAQNPHDAVIAMEKADLALQLTIKITEKAVAAYREISQMQV